MTEQDIKSVFDEIAPGWYNFRHWSIFNAELTALAQGWQKGSLLNIGCAHGPDFLPFRQDFDLYGIDISAEMIKLAQKYSRKFGFTAELTVADAGCLPFAEATFDWAISVAVYHHIRGKGAQRQALDELRRILKPGGEAFITVWNRWQPRFWFSGKETTVPWRTREKTLYRYYHLFSYPELERLVKSSGFRIIKSYPEYSYSFPFSSQFPLKFFSRNICLLVGRD